MRPTGSSLGPKHEHMRDARSHCRDERGHELGRGRHLGTKNDGVPRARSGFFGTGLAAMETSGDGHTGRSRWLTGLEGSGDSALDNGSAQVPRPLVSLGEPGIAYAPGIEPIRKCAWPVLGHKVKKKAARRPPCLRAISGTCANCLPLPGVPSRKGSSGISGRRAELVPWNTRISRAGP